MRAQELQTQLVLQHLQRTSGAKYVCTLPRIDSPQTYSLRYAALEEVVFAWYTTSDGMHGRRATLVRGIGCDRWTYLPSGHHNMRIANSALTTHLWSRSLTITPGASINALQPRGMVRFSPSHTSAARSHFIHTAGQNGFIVSQIVDRHVDQRLRRAQASHKSRVRRHTRLDAQKSQVTYMY